MEQPSTTTFVARGGLTELIREEAARHRLAELASAVREHEARNGRLGFGRRPHDEALYRRARLIFGEAA
jgi:hypothetical protein